MKAGQVALQQLLNGKIQYRVPLFQRTYSWGEDQWYRLWTDVLEIYAMEEPSESLHRSGCHPAHYRRGWIHDKISSD